jgi:NADPH:quinone reductase-like Zn-dependent oxidoreductase
VRVLPGDTVLTHGSGGVSTFAIQLAKALGARVFATTSSPEKVARLREIGADEVIDSSAIPAWDHKLRELTQGIGVDHVVETTGPVTLERSLRAVRFGPRHHRRHLRSRANRREQDLRVRRHYLALDRRQPIRAIEHHALRPIVDRVFGFDEAPAAYEHLSHKRHVGKVVIAGA